tara:strand:- start:424 stop:681 length:258 start_codon:yes stop_codon:yes gene_type:complete
MKDEDKTYENELRTEQEKFIKNQNDKIADLKKEIDRIQENYDNLKIINNNHQKLNGELRIENHKLIKENKNLKDPLKKLRNDGII